MAIVYTTSIMDLDQVDEIIVFHVAKSETVERFYRNVQILGAVLVVDISIRPIKLSK